MREIQVCNTARGIVAIRPIAASDAAAYRELRLEALRLHPSAFGSDYATDAEKPDAFWQQRVQIRDGMEMLLVAEFEQRLVGMCGVYRGSGIKSQHNGNIWGVYVRAEWRGLGLAEALLQGCIAWATAQQVKVVKLGVITTNAAAIKTYLKCGLSIYGVEPMALCVEGIYHDEFLMSRHL
jgi:ribosomal protein S18 acetylase RimI-like enzyme